MVYVVRKNLGRQKDIKLSLSLWKKQINNFSLD